MVVIHHWTDETGSVSVIVMHASNEQVKNFAALFSFLLQVRTMTMY